MQKRAKQKELVENCKVVSLPGESSEQNGFGAEPLSAENTLTTLEMNGPVVRLELTTSGL